MNYLFSLFLGGEKKISILLVYVIYALRTPLVCWEISLPKQINFNVAFSKSRSKVIHSNCRLFHLQCSNSAIVPALEVYRNLALFRVGIYQFWKVFKIGEKGFEFHVFFENLICKYTICHSIASFGWILDRYCISLLFYGSMWHKDEKVLVMTPQLLFLWEELKDVIHWIKQTLSRGLGMACSLLIFVNVYHHV